MALLTKNLPPHLRARSSLIADSPLKIFVEKGSISIARARILLIRGVLDGLLHLNGGPSLISNSRVKHRLIEKL